MALIWRVQNANGEGPYNDDWEGGNDMCDAHDDRAHPAPWVDFDDWRPPSEHDKNLICWGIAAPKDLLPPRMKALRFGFLLKKDAAKWFRGWLKRLAASGYRLVQVEGEIKCWSKTKSGQVAFLPTHDCKPVDFGPLFKKAA